MLFRGGGWAAQGCRRVVGFPWGECWRWLGGADGSSAFHGGECWRWLGSADESSAFQRGVPTGRWLAGGLGLQGVERGEGVEVAALAVEGDFFVPALSEGVAEGGAV